MSKLCVGMNDFTFAIYRELANKSGNIACSPKNISDGLSLAYPAARARTAKQMKFGARFLSVKQTLNNIRQFNAKLAADPHACIRNANGVWASQNYPFSHEYIRLLKEECGAQFATVDYKQGDLTAILKEINDWVANSTRSQAGESLVQDLLKPDMISSNSVLTIVSAIYYSSLFRLPFNPGLTRKYPFRCSNGKSMDCQMLTKQASYKVSSNELVDACEVPYAGDTCLHILLPKENVKFEDVESQLSDSFFQSCCERQTEEDVVLMFPKFKIEYDLDLTETLSSEKIGMANIFSGDADFSGAMEEEKSCSGFKVDKVVHKACVDVTEKGTEAAAATGVTTSRSMKRSPRKFIADRPFIFTISHREENVVLFIGRHQKPSGY